MAQAVFIGIGGIGSTIVTQIQRELRLRLDMAGNMPAAKAQANNYQFLLVDTWEDENAQFFAPQPRISDTQAVGSGRV